MKKLFAILFLFAIAAISCTKEYHNPTSAGNTNGNNGGTNGSGSGSGSGSGGGNGGGGGGGGSSISPVPTTFTQKALIEEFTGEWCGYCPDGALKLQAVLDANPGKVYGASLHDGDPFATAYEPDFVNLFFINPNDGFPSGLVNRVALNSSEVLWDRGAWGGAAAMQLANTATCGLAMLSYTTATDSLYVEVHCGFNHTMSGDYRLTVYLEEDKVPESPGGQHNYYDVPGAQNPDNPALNNIGNPITTWNHNDVVRKFLTAEWGNPIPSGKMIPGGEYVVKLGATYAGYVKANLKVTAFINKVGTDATTHQIMNVQQTKLSVIKNWD